MKPSFFVLGLCPLTARSASGGVLVFSAENEAPIYRYLCAEMAAR